MPGRWFEPASPSDQYRTHHIVLFWIMVAAGALLRFWNLGNAGLHGDEDLMGLAARGLLQHGRPEMPGGMIYPRAPLHTWLLATCVRLFGDTEWALRLPSAIAGVLCGPLAFVMGRRFLAPAANLAFVGTVLYLPWLIQESMTARMYILFLASLLGFGALVFHWERTEKPTSLGLAFLVWLVALQFQFLAVFAALILLFPGLARGSRKLLLQGAALLAVAAVCYLAIERITSRFYPAPGDHPVVPSPASAGGPSDALLIGGPFYLLAIALVAMAGVALLIAVARRSPALPAAWTFGLGLVLCVLEEYHLGGIALLFGAVLWARSGDRRWWAPCLVMIAVGAIAALQVAILHGDAGLSLRKTVAGLMGRPGLWPILRFADVSRPGFAAYVLILGFAAWRLARGRAIPVHFLFFVLAAWVQILAIGFFRRDVPTRYTIGALPYFLVCLIAGLGFVLDASRWGVKLQKNAAASAALWVILVAAIVNPVEVIRIARNDYSRFADHKGAAEFIRSVRPGPDDVLIAEDSIIQTYYLGRVDYRLLALNMAAEHSVVVDGVVRGQYTGTPVLGSGQELARVLDQPRRGTVYIIGSGENFADGRRSMRGNGIREVLESGRLEVIYEGRDHRTQVWRLRG